MGSIPFRFESSSGVRLSDLSDGLFDEFNDVDKHDECYDDQAAELDDLPLEKVQIPSHLNHPLLA